MKIYLVLWTLYFSESYSQYYPGQFRDYQNPIARGASPYINTAVVPGVPTSWSSLATTEPGYLFTEEEMAKFKIWPHATIPFMIDDYSFDNVMKNRIRVLLMGMNSVSGLDFSELEHPPSSESDRWVLFINRRGILECQDYTTESFTYKGVQRVVLGYDCVRSDGGPMAPIVLALAGVPPQHNAPNRDDHITVYMDNIIPEKRDLFKKLTHDRWLFQHVHYDFLSAGHYQFHKYTANGSATIVPKKEQQFAVGEDDGISIIDIWKIRMLYNHIIIKQRRPNATDCTKMFKKGSIKYEPDYSDDFLMPRKKPLQYLGYNVSDNEVSSYEDKAKLKMAKKLKLGNSYYKMQNKANSRAEAKFRNLSPRLNRMKQKLQEMPDFDTDEK